MPEATAKQAVRQFTEPYFVREISNSLSRILPGASGNKVLAFTEALSALQSRHFKATDLEKALTGELDPGDLRILLRQLYLVGTLGVYSGAGDAQHTNSVYRRSTGGGFSYITEYTLHNSLVVAWNIPW